MAFVLRWGCDRRRMRFAIAGMVVVLIACFGAVGVSGSEQGVLLDVRDARLAEVVLLLTQQSGANIVINPDVADKRITAQLHDLPLERVLDLVVKDIGGVEYWRTEDGTYVIGGKRPVEEKKPVTTEPPVAPAEPEPKQEPAKTYSQIVKLVNSDPTDVLVTLGILDESASPTSNLFGVNRYDRNRRTKPLGGVLGPLDEDRYQTGIQVPGNPRGHQETGPPPVDTVPPAIDSGSRSTSDEAGRAATPATGSGQYTGAGRPITTTATSVPGGARIVAPPTATGAGTAAATNLLPEGVDLVMPFPADNSLIVRGTVEGIAEFKELVHLLDIPPKQVNIKAEFIEVSTGDVKRLGIDWSLERLNQTINTSFNPTGNVIVGVTTGNLAASLRTELTRTSGKIINSPIISTINNEYAEISVGSVIPYWTTVWTPQGAGLGYIQTTQVNSLTVSTYLRVLPRVNGDGTITLTLMPSVQDTGVIYTSPDGKTSIPETRFQTLYTRRRVLNGETIVVGGFIRKDESVSRTEIPILGSLPLIGQLFASTSKTGQDRELLIFVTPSVIGEKSAGSAVGVAPYP